MRHEPTGRSRSVSSSGNEPASQAERSLRARLAAYALHAQHDPRETTANGRAAFLARFDREVDQRGSPRAGRAPPPGRAGPTRLLRPPLPGRRQGPPGQAHRGSQAAKGRDRGVTEVDCWRDKAACCDVVTAKYDPFFADTPELQAEAITICATCPVRDACLPSRSGPVSSTASGAANPSHKSSAASSPSSGPVVPMAARRPPVIPRRARPTASTATSSAPTTPTTPRTAIAAVEPACEAQPIRASKGGGSDAA